MPMDPQEWLPFDIPKGTPVHSTKTGSFEISGRKQTVHPYNVLRTGIWTTVTWPGSGGYWRRVVIRDDEFVDYWPTGGI